MIPDINLLPQLEKRSESSKLLYILMGLVTVLALAVFAYMFITSSKDIKNLEAQEQALSSQQTELQAQYDSMQNVNAGSLDESLAFVERVSYPVSPLIDEAQNLLMDNTYFTSYAFSAESVNLTVDFEMLSDVSRYVDALNNSEYFADVQVQSISNKEVNPTSEEQTDAQKFQEIPRYTVTIVLFIDSTYLAIGGVS